MKKAIILVVSFLLLLSACDTEQQTTTSSVTKIPAQGERIYGGTFRFNLSEPYQTLFPHSITDVMSSHIATQIYEGLVKFNPRDLTIIPCLAERWEIDSSGTIYTFYLKKGVFFHDDACFPKNKGREVKAQDFKYSFELLCSSGWENLLFQLTFKDKVVGANKYYNSTVDGKPDFGLEGVKIIDDYTLQIILEKPSYSFKFILANPATSVIAREAIEKYGIDSKIGTGPFVFARETTDTPWKLYLVKNNNYHRSDTLGNRLPFLDSIIVSNISTQKAELQTFQNGKLDVISGLPAESILNVLEEQIAYFQSDNLKYILDRSPKMTTQYYEFNTKKGVFKDKRIRKAFCYAIDRNEILENILKKQGLSPGIYGITPPSFKGYDVSRIKGYDLDILKAKNLLADAGYANGKNFPPIVLELNSGGERNEAVAIEFQRQIWENLKINVKLEVVPFEQKLEDARFAKADIFRSAWVADYPSPENFLMLLYGKNVPASFNEPSYPNTSRYVNERYDQLYEKGLSTPNISKSYDYFLKAEQIMIDDAPILVLWYDEIYILKQAYVKNYFSNPIEYYDFSEVYFEVAKSQDQEVVQ